MEMQGVAERVAAVRRGELDPGHRLQDCLQRIARAEPQVQAWVAIDADSARREAERIHRAARQGRRLGPLAGSIWGVKDIFDMRGWPTRCGSRSLQDRPAAAADAAVVAWLREADAILLGKTHTAEFACFDPPVTRNPADLERTPGGSSSGSAAAVACGMCDAALGTQTGGSIIRPAAFCGVAGLMPRLDAIPTQGVSPVSYQLDHVGALAATVADLAYLWTAWTGGEPLVARRPQRLLLLQPWWDDSATAPQHDALRLLKAAGAGDRRPPPAL